MNLINRILILLTLSGVSIAEQKIDDLCLTDECVQSAALLSSSIDHTVDPCDDFYQYSCGNWQKDHPKINNLEGWSHFSKLTHEMGDNLIKLLSNSSIEKDPKYLHPMINFYRGCVNSNVRNVHQIRDFDSIKGVIKRIGGWPLIDSNWLESNYSIENAFIELNKFMVSKVILDIQVSNDAKNNTKPIVGIGNPFIPQKKIEGIYRIPSEDDEPVYSFYDGVKTNAQIVAETLKGSFIDLLKWQNDMGHVQALDMALRKIATRFNDNSYALQNYDHFKIPVRDLDKFKGIGLRKILDGILKAEDIVLHDDDLIIADIDYLKSLGHVLSTAGKRAIANMLAINVVMILGKFTTTSMAKTIISTSTSIPVDFESLLPRYCLGYTQEIFPDLLGRYYMDRMFDKESINDMKEFISNIKEAFNIILEENEWMDKTTKEHSIKKLKAIKEYIAFPDYIVNDTELLQYHSQFSDLLENNFLASMIKALNNQRRINLRLYKEGVLPKGHWPGRVSGVVINAFYNPQFNGIFFPAGIAQFPFFQHKRTKTLNLGAIGMVIAHELTHSFDNKGSLFDERGNLFDWFSNSSREIFKKKSQCFVNQYNQFRYDLGNHSFVNINGNQTLGENIADNGGVRIAYKALQLHKTKNSGKLLKLPGLLSTKSEEQIFFMSFANIWCSNKSPASINNQISRDPHSIENARIIATLSNFKPFADAFGCREGSRMNPKDKCQLW